MVDIPVKAKVECTDGPCGTSIAVIVNPTTRTVTHVVVEARSALDPDQRMVPVEQIKETTAAMIRLGCSKAEFAEMQPFIERRFIEEVWDEPAYWYGVGDMYMEPYVTPAVPPYEEVQRIPPGELAIYRGTWVEATDGHVGTVGELVIDPSSGHITHLVLQEGHLWGKKEVALPLSAIDRVEVDAVYLKLDKQAIERLPATPLKRHYQKDKGGGKEIELVARVFDSPGQASEALDFVESLHRQKVFRLLNAAVLIKEEDGTTSLKDTRDLEPKKGRILGAIAGGLVGLLGGPIGVVVGALAGVGAGSLVAKWVDLGFSDKFLKELQGHLQPGSSALIVLVEHEWVQPMSEALSGLGGIVLQQTLTDEMVEELMEASESED